MGISITCGKCKKELVWGFGYQTTMYTCDCGTKELEIQEGRTSTETGTNYE